MEGDCLGGIEWPRRNSLDMGATRVDQDRPHTKNPREQKD